MVLHKRNFEESDDEEPTQEIVDNDDTAENISYDQDDHDDDTNLDTDDHDDDSSDYNPKEDHEQDDENTEEEEEDEDEEDQEFEQPLKKYKNQPDKSTSNTAESPNSTSTTSNKRKNDTVKFNSGNNSKTQRTEDGLIELPLTANVNHNQQITDILNQVALFEKNRGATHKYNAYRKAIQSIRVYPKKLSSGSESQKLDGVGAKIAKKVQEILDTGKLTKLIKLLADEKLVAINNISRVSGIGPAIAKKLVEEGVTSIEKLKKVKTLTHHQQVGLKYFDDIEQRIPREEIEKIESICVDALKKIDKDALAETCGSYRRGAATSGDIDILLTHPKYNKDWKLKSKKNESFNLIERLVKALKDKGVIIDDISLGPMKYMGCCILPNELNKSTSKEKNPSEPIVRRIDFKLVPMESYYFGLLHNTGSDEFNRQMRAIALSKGYTLSEYSINKILGAGANNKSEDVIVHSEREIFDIIGMKYYAPTMRSL